jgi:phosphatidylserine/phosphatidylglycerophosphate/cardiolipin synthase-like enzyme
MKKFAWLLLLVANLAYAGAYQVCFTPGQDCTALIVSEIDNAKQTVFVQAYSFTSAPIAKALVDANKRGIKVYVLLDKSQSKSNRYTSSTFLKHNSIPVWIDYKPAIAHNKVMVIDRKTVITGSFNFTKAAQQKNAENVLIINDESLAKQYLENWDRRKTESREEN